MQTWKDLLINAAEKIISHNPDAFNKLPDSEIMRGTKKPYLTKDKALLRRTHRLSNGLFLETDLNANSIVLVINKLLIGCGCKETDIKIFYK